MWLFLEDLFLEVEIALSMNYEFLDRLSHYSPGGGQDSEK